MEVVPHALKPATAMLWATRFKNSRRFILAISFPLSVKMRIDLDFVRKKPSFTSAAGMPLGTGADILCAHAHIARREVIEFFVEGFHGSAVGAFPQVPNTKVPGMRALGGEEALDSVFHRFRNGERAVEMNPRPAGREYRKAGIEILMEIYN